MTGGHPDPDLLLLLAEGDGGAVRELREHLDGCAACRSQVAALRGFLAAVGDELIEERSACLGTDELATAGDHPHLADCALCRDERQALLALEASRQLERLRDGGLTRASHVERGGRLQKVAAVGAPVLELTPGATRTGTVAGTRVELTVAGDELLVRLSGAPERPLVLVLTSDLVERRVDLGTAELRLPVGRWRRARVEERGG